MVSVPATTGALNSKELWDELDQLTTVQLEEVISRSASAKADDARFVLGRLQIEGTFEERVAFNDTQGNEHLKTAAKNNHIASLEYLTYHAIRFDRHPNVKKIMDGLLRVTDELTNNCSRACNTIAEFAHA